MEVVAQDACSAVPAAVQNNAEHVPYGKSCLTRLLADCMGYARSRVVFMQLAGISPLTLPSAGYERRGEGGTEHKGHTIPAH